MERHTIFVGTLKPHCFTRTRTHSRPKLDSESMKETIVEFARVSWLQAVSADHAGDFTRRLRDETSKNDSAFRNSSAVALAVCYIFGGSVLEKSGVIHIADVFTN